MATSKFDRNDNMIIGDGRYHANYHIEDFSEYPEVSYEVEEALTSESVYIRYYNSETKKACTCRFSWHKNNAVKFGDQLDGRVASRMEILYALGLAARTFTPDTKLALDWQYVKKSKASSYPQLDMTLPQLYALGEGANIDQYAGMVLAGTNILINGGTIKRIVLHGCDCFGNTTTYGTYHYQLLK